MRTLSIAACSLICATILSAGPASAVTVDVTATKGVTFGGAIGGAGGKFVPWGGSVVLDEKDAFIRANGRCAFNVNYDMQNNGNSTTAQFKNYLTAKDAIVAINSALTLKAGESKQVSTQPYLMPGSFGFSLKLDAENSLSESDETNNAVYVKVTLNGTCGATPAPAPAPKADLTSQRGVAVGGHSTPWGSTITLGDKDALLMANGQCAFTLVYDVANIGAANSGAFSDAVVVGNRVLSQQSGISVDKGQSKLVFSQIYLAPGANQLRLLIDSNRNADESNEGNNEFNVTVKVESKCTATTVPPKRT
jgi:hypothetical protein